MPTAIPLAPNLAKTGFFDVQATLDDTTYTLQFGWNNRTGEWFLQVRDAQDQTVLCGDAKCVVDFPLYAYFVGRQPAGLFFFYDTSGKSEEIVNIGDLGQRVQLQYFSAVELAGG